MKIILEYQGKTYEGAVDKNHTAEEVRGMMYKDIASLDKLYMELAGGGFIVIGENVLKSCVIKILDT